MRSPKIFQDMKFLILLNSQFGKGTQMKGTTNRFEEDILRMKSFDPILILQIMYCMKLILVENWIFKGIKPLKWKC
jgi:hypothetical protein